MPVDTGAGGGGNRKGAQTLGFFSGKFTHRLDRKGRISIPARWRPLLGGGPNPGVFAASFGEDGFIECYPEESMAERREKLRERSGHSEEQNRLLAFAMFSDYPALPLDTDGRIVVPVDLLQRTGFLSPDAPGASRGHKLVHSEAILAGSGDRFFIFRPDAIDAFATRAREALANVGPSGA